jgi:nicotinate dehydrogenase subunit B
MPEIEKPAIVTPESDEIEFERYELRSGPAYRFTPDRRDFFKLLGGGIILFLALAPESEAQEGGRRGGGRSEPLPQDLGAWLHIGEDGAITVYTGKVEVGQNSRTSLTQAAAEELHTGPESIHLVMGDTDLVPWDAGTFGSQTTPRMAPQIHKVAAVGREMLLDLAAEKWHADRSALVCENGRVRNTANGQVVTFGELTKGQKLTKTIASDTPVTPASQWKVGDTNVEKVGARDMVTGKHRYAYDVTRPGMLYGRIVRPPAFHAKLASVDTKTAEQMPGITVVHDGDFIGVASTDPQKLSAAADAIKAEWKTEQQPSASELFSYLKTHPAEANRGAGAETSSSAIDEAIRNSDGKAEATYTIAYIAHTPLEPRAAVAEWSNGKLTVWTGSQCPFRVRDELVEAFGLSRERVRVLIPDTGSAYGGKHNGEAAIEAARLAKAAGKPVKINWTREEEMTWAYFRPAGVIEVRSGARKDGAITAWDFHNYNSGPSAVKSSYHIPNERAEFHATQSPLRQGSYRGLAATANHFARESHMDELAHAVGMEPLAFRLKNTTDARLRRVYETVAERFGWSKAKTRPGQGYGIAGGFEKGGYFACCVEIAVPPSGGPVKIERVVEAFDCGPVVNPEHLKNQVEGAIVQGLGGALFEAIDFDNGRIVNPKLSKYRVPRFSDVPHIESILIDPKDVPSSGAGETPIMGVAPAIANAVFDATGKRIRSMPLKI